MNFSQSFSVIEVGQDPDQVITKGFIDDLQKTEVDSFDNFEVKIEKNRHFIREIFRYGRPHML